MLFTLKFWKDAVERALKTAAQAAVLALLGPARDPGTGLNVWSIDLHSVVGLGAGGFVLSILFSVGSDMLPIGTKGTASLVNLDGVGK